MKTFYQAQDRQGTKYFPKIPAFRTGFDLFVGEGWTYKRPRNARIVKKFKYKILSSGNEHL